MGPIQVQIEEVKELICDLCRTFYNQGWVSGTGGGISVKANAETIVMAPSGVQKERMRPEDMYVLDAAGNEIQVPEARPPPYKPPKLSECAPLFMAAYELREAGAVMHSHSIHAVLATILDENATEFKVTNLEMIKGIMGHGYYDECIVPIIENTARECELTDRLRKAIQDYPKANAVLVRRHGVYVWGSNWIEAKTQSECYHYLFETAVKMRSMGISAAIPQKTNVEMKAELSTAAVIPQSDTTMQAETPNKPPVAAEVATQQIGHALKANGHKLDTKKRRIVETEGQKQAYPRAIVLDIEGTITPIWFVSEILFPYARSHIKKHLNENYGTKETQDDIEALRQQALEDLENDMNVAEIPAQNYNKDEVIAACITNISTQMKNDRKSTALKQLQGHIWRKGYQRGDLKGEVFPEVKGALEEWMDLGIKTYIYSSGSREAQSLLFTHSKCGDLRPYLMGYFDTTAGSKTEAESYKNIALSIGCDNPQEILFVTDRLNEAVAAAEAGWKVQVAIRDGNPPVEQDFSFPQVHSMKEVLSALA
eukprot:TRINITY_DN503_c0_g2_i1.p1 TRINITY_DN503_c0_g2~~TRINITY_DN503_c0_g2_i1.p1  ORF type:complete len:584 (+),score=92.86 TRINITY_DN503_c0_g2_i1:133-1752(+)